MLFLMAFAYVRVVVNIRAIMGIVKIRRMEFRILKIIRILLVRKVHLI